jgi:hypothetical protein
MGFFEGSMSIHLKLQMPPMIAIRRRGKDRPLTVSLAKAKMEGKEIHGYVGSHDDFG